MAKRALLLLALVFVTAACGGGANRGSDSTGTPGSSVGDHPLYIALGDSLSQGIGASDIGKTAFVPLVAASLDGYELLNLGHGGDTSTDLFEHGHVDEAIATIKQRNGDADKGNDVRLVTLEIGGNDLLRIYFSLVQTGTCPNVATSLAKPQCVEALRSALNGFVPNIETALDRLRNADASLPVLLLTLYNPFQHFPGVGALGELSLEGLPGTPFPEGLNDLIRASAETHDGVTVVDIYSRFQGRSQELISGDLIHPNDAGYQVMADAVIEAAATVLR